MEQTINFKIRKIAATTAIVAMLLSFFIIPAVKIGDVGFMFCQLIAAVGDCRMVWVSVILFLFWSVLLFNPIIEAFIFFRGNSVGRCGYVLAILQLIVLALIYVICHNGESLGMRTIPLAAGFYIYLIATLALLIITAFWGNYRITADKTI